MSKADYSPAVAYLEEQPASAFEQLVEAVLERRRQPEDRYEIAAILESLGWNDERAEAAFGVEDVFALADEIWDTVSQRFVSTPFELQEKLGGIRLIMEVIRSFLRGLIFALPMAISVFAMLTLRFSLWSYERLSIDFATSIAIGTILSFLTVGGFTQAIARRGFFYLSQHYYYMSRKITFYFIRVGFLACACVSVVIYLADVIFNLYPSSMFWIIVLYYFFLNSIWLSVTVMYLLRKELTFTGLIACGIAIVYLLFKIVDMPIIQAQLIAVSLVSIAGMGLAYYFFRQAEKKEEKGIAPKLTRLSVMVYGVMPYFIYGFLYFAFLYTDRVMAWSTDHAWDPDQQYMPYFLWFRGPYELGLDFALLVLMIPLGISEVVVSKMMRDLETSQKSFLGFDTQRMNDLYRSMYLKMLGVISIASLISALLVYWALIYFDDKYMIYYGKHLIADDGSHASWITWFVFYISLAAYAILSIGLMNAVILFSLSQPQFVNRALVPALAVNVLTGFLLTRWVDYSWAVIGLLLGSVMFAVLSTQNLLKVLKKLDYYLYATS
ncbi:hypothetical protein O9H85_09380 [Paenibacillus filicis]|uniref:Uncharacterized protein n=1 Tax=Paenibacillus gyeongsangnamensis TaxID=3388067 RepID=A0ABT4Q7D2_9BACL|nr:hypothetical protein [Paenibacillus filicis]MCZ8512620.1 hypothetical protein [Paenibacillus filicis]